MPSTSPGHHQIVLCCFGMAFMAFGLGFYGLGVYLIELRELNGWSAGSISTAFTVFNLIVAGLVSGVSDAIKRYGAPLVVIGSALVLSLGAALIPQATELWHLYSALALMAIGVSGTGAAAINAILAQWFVHGLGRPLSLALTGVSCAGIIVTPALLWLTDQYGFRVGLWLLVAAMLICFCPLWVWLLRSSPAEIRSQSSHSTRSDAMLSYSALLHDRGFLTTTAAFALGLTAQVGFLMHQVAYLSSVFDVRTAGWCVSLTTASALLGRIGFGLCVDRFDSRLAATVNFLMQSGSLFLFYWMPSSAVLYTGCIVFGITAGNMIVLPALVVRSEFAAEDFGRANSLQIAITQFVLAFGPGLIGIVHDWAGGYGPALLLCVAFHLAASICILVRGSKLGQLLARKEINVE